MHFCKKQALRKVLWAAQIYVFRQIGDEFPLSKLVQTYSKLTMLTMSIDKTLYHLMSYLKFVFTFLRETIFSIILIFVLSEILTRQTDTKSYSLLWLYNCTQIVKTGFTDTVQVYRRNVHGRNITHVKVEERVTPNRRISVLVKTDGRTDRQTDRLTDICPSRAASSQLKS